MKKYILKRLLQIPITLLGVTILVFMITQLAPGDPAVTATGSGARPEQVEAVRKDLGLDRPIAEQYFDYIKNLLHGDLGMSLVKKTPIASDIMTALKNTLYILVIARIWSLAVAIPLGIWAAKHKGTWIDKLCTTTSLIGVSIPTFFLGLVCAWFFGYVIKVLPISGMGDSSMFSIEGIKHMILPAFVMGVTQLGSITRVTRSAMIDSLNCGYIRTAKAKGLSQKGIIYKHALKNAVLPLVTVTAMETGLMLSGSIVTETIFNWPGIARLIVTSILANDYPTVQGCVLVCTLIFVLLNFLADILYAVIDPRIKY